MIGAVVGSAVGTLVGAAVGGSSVGEGTSLASTAGALVGLWSVYLGLMGLWLRSERGTPGAGGWSARFGFRLRPVDLPLGVTAGLVSSALVVQAVYLALRAAGVVDEGDLERLGEPARRLGESATGGGFVVLAVLIGIGAPVVEELFFRGFLQRALVARTGPVVGVGTTAAVFGAVHLQLLQFPALFAFGIVLGVLAHLTGRLGPGIVAHVAFNGLTLAALALSG